MPDNTRDVDALVKYDQQFIGLPEFGGYTSDEYPAHMGDCLRASVATVLQRDPSTLQHYVEVEGKHYMDAMNEDVPGFEWVLRAPLQGLSGNSTPTGLAIAWGDSPRGNGMTHAIVVNEHGAMVHDPHPSRGGLTCIRGAYILMPLADLARKAVPDTQEGYDCAMPHIHGLMRRDPSPFDPFPTHYDPCPTCSYKLKCEALEAALTTANERVRVLEGVAEWLAQHIAGWNKQDHADHGISTWTENESLDYWLAAAHEAVKKAHDDRRG